MNRCPSNNFFNILAGIIGNYPYGNVCLCRIIMNACNNNFISVPYIDLHDTKNIDINMERVQGPHNKLSMPVLSKGKPKLVLSCLIICRGKGWVGR